MAKKKQIYLERGQVEVIKMKNILRKTFQHMGLIVIYTL